MKMRPLLSILCALALTAPACQAADRTAGDVVGAVITYKVQKNDDLSRIAQKFGVGIVELQAANPGVNPWKPKVGTEITVGAMHVLPAVRHEGIVINLETSRLFVFRDGKEVMSFPIASGKPGWETPVAETKVTLKRKDPIWTPTPNIRAENPDLPDFVPAGPNNPLGKYAISLGLNGIMIHGTNAPSSVGKKVSHGCMRMYAKDIERVFNAVKVGMPVTLMKSSHEMGWQGNTLYLQMAPKVHKAKKEHVKYKPNLDLYAEIQKMAGPGATIDWTAVEGAVLRADGIPVPIAERPYAPQIGPEEQAVPASATPDKQEKPEERHAALEVVRQASAD